ncbi:MAG: hypothetical protein VX836_03580 [Pseudomonadota bacterium]|jgi:hypothetical protein|nr:hypothetical protein [Pseudomonadota bacterium]
MARSLTPFAVRRRRNLGWLLVLVLVLLAAHTAYSAGLGRGPFFSGWLLLSAVLLASVYSQRKRLSMLPIGRASTWLQLHAYTGAFALFVFALHTDLSLPDAPLEWLLWLSFVGTAGSGLAGLYWSRVLPPRLATTGEEVLFERIPMFVGQLRKQAEQAVLDAARDSESTLLGEHYQRNLSGFFAAPHWHLRHLRREAANAHRGSRLSALDRYLSEVERPYAQRLISLCQQKADLDMHYTIQGLLKAWLFVHVPLTGVMLVLATVHVVVAYAFGGG